MKKSLFLLSLALLLIFSILLMLFLGFNGLLESLVHGIGLSAVVIIFLFAFSILLFALIDRRYMKELHNVIETLEHISTNRVDLTYRFNEKGVGEVFSLNQRLNIFFSLLHNHVFKVKRLIDRNRDIGTLLQRSSENMDDAVKSSYDTFSRLIKEEKRNTKNLREAQQSFQEVQNLIRTRQNQENRNENNDTLYFLSKLLVLMEKTEKYLKIVEHSNLESEAELTRIAEELKIMLYGSERISSFVQESQFNTQSMKVNAAKIHSMDVTTLKSRDGIPLVGYENHQREFFAWGTDPRRPEDPNAFPEDDARRWYDYEYSGWGIEKGFLPVSPADGPEGKRVLFLQLSSFKNPYLAAYQRGMMKMADAFGIELDTLSSQSNFRYAVESAVQEKPDMIIIFAENAELLTDSLEFINQAGIPVIVSNSMPSDAGSRYVLAACGPDDWGMGRLLAQQMASFREGRGGYCILRHHPDSLAYISRTFSVITELKKIAPEMACLDKQPTLSREGARFIVSEWINRFGEDLTMIITSDPGENLIGVFETLDKYNRNDIAVGTFGNCLISQQFLKENRLHAMIWQSAEGEGALALELAIDWFNGLDIPPIRYLPMRVITHADVDSYFPAQW